jgi:hypothetical protein
MGPSCSGRSGSVLTPGGTPSAGSRSSTSEGLVDTPSSAAEEEGPTQCRAWCGFRRALSWCGVCGDNCAGLLGREGSPRRAVGAWSASVWHGFSLASSLMSEERQECKTACRTGEGLGSARAWCGACGDNHAGVFRGEGRPCARGLVAVSSESELQQVSTRLSTHRSRSGDGFGEFGRRLLWRYMEERTSL